MNITRIAIKNNRTTLVLFLVLILAGFQAYIDMPRAYDPGFIIRAAQVVTYFPGASPERVELLVSDPLEKVVQEIPELDFVTSESRTGVSILSVNIKANYKNMRPIWDDLRRKIEGAAPALPEGVQQPIVNDEFGDVYGIVLALSGEGYSYAELKQVADEVKDAFLRIDDVSKVEILGHQEERVFVEYNNVKLSELNFSPSQLSKELSARNIVISGGNVKLGDERIELEPSGNFESVNDIKHTLLTIPGSSQVIYLKDIADVYRGYVDPPSSKTRYNDKPVLALAISMSEGGNNIRLGENVMASITTLMSQYPIGIDINAVSFSPKEVEEKVDSFVSNLVQAVVVVALVMLVILGLRTGLVVSLLIPASMLMAFFVMSLINVGIDQISLAALIIALGMLVDNGIVVSESIMVKMQEGIKPLEAAAQSAKELMVPLLTSSLTTAAAFLPIYLAESDVGEFTASLFIVVSITLLCSWMISMTVIPMLCMYFLKPTIQQQNFDTLVYRNYRVLLNWLLQRRAISLVAVLFIFFVGMSGFKYVPNVFFPPSDRTYFKLELELPLGTDIERTEDVVKKFETYLQSELMAKEGQAGVTDWVTYVGSGGVRFILSHTPHSTSSNYALMVVNVNDYRVIDDLIAKINTFAFNNFPDLMVTGKRFESGGAVKSPVEIRLSGHDQKQLFNVVAKLKNKLRELEGVSNISDDWGQQIKKLRVDINQAKALRAGVSSEDIAVSLQAGLSGFQLTEFREGDNSIPVYMRSTSAGYTDLQRLQSLSIFSQVSGTSLPLSQVAEVVVEWQSSKILRRDRVKTVVVGAQVLGVTSAEVFSQLRPWLNEQQSNWPVGYSYELGGDAESSEKGNQSIAEKLPIAVFIILFLLVAQFNSVRKSMIILVTIPLGLVGVVIGLLVAKSFFGFMTLLGIVSLAGIVINNAIVLLERIKLEIDEGSRSPYDSIVHAAQQRLRPILLTTATTVLGLIPLYLGGGEMWEPLAVAIMAGLLFSTLLTLGVVPLLYALLFNIRKA